MQRLHCTLSTISRQHRRACSAAALSSSSSSSAAAAPAVPPLSVPQLAAELASRGVALPSPLERAALVEALRRSAPPPPPPPPLFATSKAKGDALELRVARIALLEGHAPRHVRRNVVLVDGFGNRSEADVVFGRVWPTFVECKHYDAAASVGLEEVAKFRSVLELNGVPAARGLFVTTGGFSPRARTIGVRTLDGRQLDAWERRAEAGAARRRAARAALRALALALALLIGAVASAPDVARRWPELIMAARAAVHDDSGGGGGGGGDSDRNGGDGRAGGGGSGSRSGALERLGGALERLGRALGLYDEAGEDEDGDGDGGFRADEESAPLPGAELAGAALLLLLEVRDAFLRGLDPPPTVVPPVASKLAAAAAGYWRSLVRFLAGLARTAEGPGDAGAAAAAPPPLPEPPLLSQEGLELAAARAAAAARRELSREGLLRAAERAGEAARHAREAALGARDRAEAAARAARESLPW